MSVVAVLIVWLAVAVTAGIVATNKGRSGLGWFLLCFFLTPLAILPLLALKPRYENMSGVRLCPRCSEYVQASALSCRHCGYKFQFAPATK